MKLLIVRKAEKELDKIPDPLALKISRHILGLSKNPFPANSKKLKGEGNYRIRIGSYRVVFYFNKKKREITILRVAHRKTVYR